VEGKTAAVVAASTPPAAPTPAAEAIAGPVQVGVLTAQTKREIVAAARELIGDPARWMPGLGDDGKLAYAAKPIEGRLTRVDASSADATHFSLLGAILSEMSRRNVVTTATGRTEFLDREIPEAIQKVLAVGSRAAAEGGAPEPTDPRLMSISHAQSLEVLQRLESEYAAKSGAEAESPALRELRGATLDELMVRVAKDEAISSTELLRAVHRGLTDQDRRITELEKAVGAPGPTIG